jgi:glycine/D-amino acid oxidase-like deaminating enzyme
MIFTEKSYWFTTRPYEAGPPLRDTVDVDVAVVGGGFTGLSCAYFLRQADPSLRIALLEAEVIGYGASGRNGGFSMTKIGMLNSLTARRFGRQRAAEAHHYADRAVTLVRDLVAQLELECDYEHPGLLTVATSPAYARRLERELDLAAKLGLPGISAIDAEELGKRVNSPLYVGGAWWEPNCGILNPAKLAWEWRDVIRAAGVEVYERTPVSSVTRTPAGITDVGTPFGRVRARKVVFATNAWSHRFAPLRFKQVPVWTYIVLTEPLTTAQLADVRWSGHEGIEDFRDLVHYYRLTADDRILFGGRDVGLWDGASMLRDRDETLFGKLREDLQTTFPPLRGIGFTHSWGGPVSATLDLFPALGYAGGRDWVYSVGCVGHGVSTTHLNGQAICDLVLERDTELTETFFVNRRVPAFPPGPLRGPVMRGIAGYLRWEDRRLDVLPR